MESEFEVMRKRIRELRETAGLSQNRLGKLAGIQQASINRYEAYFRSEMEQKLRLQSEEKLRVAKKRIAQAEKRIGA